MSEATQAAGNTPATGSAPTGTGAAGASGAAAAAAPAAATAAPAAATAPAPSSQQATEGQPAGAAAPAASSPSPAPAPAKAGAPERYEFKATGVDDAVLAEFSTVAKELGLSQVDAQKVLDKLVPKVAEGNAKAVSQAINQASQEWAKATQADPEIGGEKLTENLATAKKALERFGTPELRALLNGFDPKNNPKGTGLGNHPDVVKLFHRIGKAISEDKFVAGNTQPDKAPKDLAATLYPKSTKA